MTNENKTGVIRGAYNTTMNVGRKALGVAGNVARYSVLAGTVALTGFGGFKGGEYLDNNHRSARANVENKVSGLGAHKLVSKTASELAIPTSYTGAGIGLGLGLAAAARGRKNRK